MVETKEIGQRLLKLRQKMQKSREEVAFNVGISVSALTMYEIGKRVPRDEIKVRLADYYKCSVASIFLIIKDTKRD